MFPQFSWRQPFLVAALSGAACVAQASITVYTSFAEFRAATANIGTDAFDDVKLGEPTGGPLVRTVGAFSYTADTLFPPPDNTPGGSLFGTGTVANPGLGTSIPTDLLSFGAFSPNVMGFGANFYGTDLAGVYTIGDLTVTASDASGTVTSLLISAEEISFLGFVSTTGILTATVAAIQPNGGNVWPTVDNVVLANAIPEASSFALMLAGLGALGLTTRRRGHTGRLTERA